MLVSFAGNQIAATAERNAVCSSKTIGRDVDKQWRQDAWRQCSICIHFTVKSVFSVRSSKAHSGIRLSGLTQRLKYTFIAKFVQCMQKRMLHVDENVSRVHCVLLNWQAWVTSRNLGNMPLVLVTWVRITMPAKIILEAPNTSLRGYVVVVLYQSPPSDINELLLFV